MEADDLNASNGHALTNVGYLVLAIMQDKRISDLTPEELSLTPKFADPARHSLAAQADAMAKMIQVIPWIGESDVVLEEFGFDSSKITRLLADKKRNEGLDFAKELLLGAGNADTNGG